MPETDALPEANRGSDAVAAPNHRSNRSSRPHPRSPGSASRGGRRDRASGAAKDEPTGGWSGYLEALGPGLVTGASDDDPSGIATYSQAGAQFRYGSLWTVLISFPLMAAIQEICDRTALTTGESLGKLARRRFSGTIRVVIGVLLVALLIANG